MKNKYIWRLHPLGKRKQSIQGYVRMVGTFKEGREMAQKFGEGWNATWVGISRQETGDPSGKSFQMYEYVKVKKEPRPRGPYGRLLNPARKKNPLLQTIGLAANPPGSKFERVYAKVIKSGIKIGMEVFSDLKKEGENPDIPEIAEFAGMEMAGKVSARLARGAAIAGEPEGTQDREYRKLWPKFTKAILKGMEEKLKDSPKKNFDPITIMGVASSVKGLVENPYIPQIYQLKDRLGNTRNVEVSFDKDSKTYVASILGGRFHRMFDGSERQGIVALGEASTPLEAADNAILNFNDDVLLIPYSESVYAKEEGRKMKGRKKNPDIDLVARTILQQMGGMGRLKSMIGAKEFIDRGRDTPGSRGSLSFKWNSRWNARGRKSNYLKITLSSNDTYVMEFGRVTGKGYGGWGADYKPIKTFDGVYADMLIPIFEEQTGLYLRLNNPRKKAGEKALQKAIGEELDKDPDFFEKLDEWKKKELAGEFDHLMSPPQLKAALEERAAFRKKRRKKNPLLQTIGLGLGLNPPRGPRRDSKASLRREKLEYLYQEGDGIQRWGGATYEVKGMKYRQVYSPGRPASGWRTLDPRRKNPPSGMSRDAASGKESCAKCWSTLRKEEAIHKEGAKFGFPPEATICCRCLGHTYCTPWTGRSKEWDPGKKNPLLAFQVGESYKGRSSGSDISFTVLKRTPSFITVDFITGGGGLARGRNRLKVKVYEGREVVLPWGSYANAPAIFADQLAGSAVRVVDVEVPGEALLKAKFACEEEYSNCLDGLETSNPSKKLTTAQRRRLPASDYGLPKSRRYPMQDRGHAIAAKGRATQMLEKGYLTQDQWNRITAKADRVLGEKVPARLRAVANPDTSDATTEWRGGALGARNRYQYEKWQNGDFGMLFFYKPSGERSPWEFPPPKGSWKWRMKFWPKDGKSIEATGVTPSKKAAFEAGKRAFSKYHLRKEYKKGGPVLRNRNPLTHKEQRKLYDRGFEWARESGKYKIIGEDGKILSPQLAAQQFFAGRATEAREVGEEYGPIGREGIPLRRKNPSSVSIPFKKGQKIPVQEARSWIVSNGDKTLLKQFDQALRLQTKANKKPKFVEWQELSIGTPDKIDAITAFVNYGTTPESMYKPPKGSHKGTDFYVHQWGEDNPDGKPVPVLVSPDGKNIITPIGKGQKIDDWMRG